MRGARRLARLLFLELIGEAFLQQALALFRRQPFERFVEFLLQLFKTLHAGAPLVAARHGVLSFGFAAATSAGFTAGRFAL